MGGLSFIFGLMALAVYFLPVLVASQRKSKRLGGIFVLNFFLGWTVIGWVVALSWAAGSDKANEGKEKLANHVSVADELTKLSQLHKDGVIKADEFEAQKKAILSR